MSELVRMPNNIYEALILQLANLINGPWSTYNNMSFSTDYYNYEDDKANLQGELSNLYYLIDGLNKHVIGYFMSVYQRIIEAPMGLNVDVEYGIPMHKVFECLVAAEVGGYVVGGRNDGGVDVIDPNRNIIIQCKSGNSHARIARTIYAELIQSCINEEKTRAILAVTDANFLDINNYPDLQGLAQQNAVDIELKRWERYDITHPSPPIGAARRMKKKKQEFQNNLEILLIFLNQIQTCIGNRRRINWDYFLANCINGVQNLPQRFDDIESDIYHNLNCLESAYEDDDSMEPWEKAFMEGANRSYSDSDEDQEDSDQNQEDSDQEDSDQEDSDQDQENSDQDQEDGGED